MAKDFQFFLCDVVEEKQILKLFENKFGLEICSQNFQNDNAIGYLFFMEKEGDIKIDANVALPDHVNITMTEEEIAIALSEKFKTEVIYFNPDINDKREFHMIDENRNKYAINIKYENENGETLEEWKIIDKIKI